MIYGVPYDLRHALSLLRMFALKRVLPRSSCAVPGLMAWNSLGSMSGLAPLLDSVVPMYRSSTAGSAFWHREDTTLAAVAIDSCSERLATPDHLSLQGLP